MTKDFVSIEIGKIDLPLASGRLRHPQSERIGVDVGDLLRQHHQYLADYPHVLLLAPSTMFFAFRHIIGNEITNNNLKVIGGCVYFFFRLSSSKLVSLHLF